MDVDQGYKGRKSVRAVGVFFAAVRTAVRTVSV